MAIDGGLRNNLPPGIRLTAKYKGAVHTAEVVLADGKTLFRLADGREFKSPSAAGSAVIGGSCNGWRFWSLEGSESASPATKPTKTAVRPAKAKTTRAPGAGPKTSRKAVAKAESTTADPDGTEREPFVD